MWDDQVIYCTTKGWHCLRYDLFGYGKSIPSATYLAKDPRPPIRHHHHTAQVVEALFGNGFGQRTPTNQKVIVVALSRGANIAVDFALSRPELVLCAGGLGGFEIANTSDEEAMLAQVDEFMSRKDALNTAKMNVRIWGNGTQAKEGRMGENSKEKLFKWCKDIAEKELSGKGGDLPCENLQNPPAVERRSEIKVKTIVAIGKHGESSTNAAMRYFAQHLPGAAVKEFEAAHMINLDCPVEFNQWLGAYLAQFPQ